MKNTFKGLCVFSAAFAVLCLQGCSMAKHGKPPDNPTVEQATYAAEYKTLQPPEDGWTMDELLGVTYLYGTPLSSPLTLNSLGKEVEGRDKQTNVAGKVMILIYHGDKIVANALYNETSVDEVDGDTPFAYIHFSGDKNDPESLVVNGKQIETEYGDMTEHLGKTRDGIEGHEGSVSTMTGYYYKVKDDSFTIETINDDGKFSALVLKELNNRKD